MFLSDDELTKISNKVIYKVKSGDTLWSIGKIFNVTVNELVIYNNIENRNLIYIDEIIKIPNNKTIEYTVKPGDTLTKIAQMFNTTVEIIAKANDIENINLIYVNEKLKIN